MEASEGGCASIVSTESSPEQPSSRSETTRPAVGEMFRSAPLMGESHLKALLHAYFSYRTFDVTVR